MWPYRLRVTNCRAIPDFMQLPVISKLSYGIHCIWNPLTSKNTKADFLVVFTHFPQPKCVNQRQNSKQDTEMSL